jgi:hypothetical protein
MNSDLQVLLLKTAVDIIKQGYIVQLKDGDIRCLPLTPKSIVRMYQKLKKELEQSI